MKYPSKLNLNYGLFIELMAIFAKNAAIYSIPILIAFSNIYIILNYVDTSFILSNY